MESWWAQLGGWTPLSYPRESLLVTCIWDIDLNIISISKIIKSNKEKKLGWRQFLCFLVQFRGQYWREESKTKHKTKLKSHWLVCTVMSEWLGGISRVLWTSVACVPYSLYWSAECCLTHSCVDCAASPSYLNLLFSDIARFCLDRPVVFLLTPSSIMNILVAQRSWTRAFVVVNSS